MGWFLQVFDPAAVGAFFTQFQLEMQHPAFWLSVGQIIWINVLLSGDNALVIAMACRALEPRQRLWGMILGALAAVVLRIIFTGIVVTLMELPYLKLVGGLALIFIAVKLLIPEPEGEEGVKSGANIWSAVQIVVVADIVMSLDNVIAVAAAAKGSMPLLILGLAVSVPMIVGGAALIMMLLTRVPALVWVGAILLGWVAGGVIATDVAVGPALEAFFSGGLGLSFDRVLGSIGIGAHFSGGHHDGIEDLFGVLAAITVVIAGLFWRSRRSAHAAQAV